MIDYSTVGFSIRNRPPISDSLTHISRTEDTLAAIFHILQTENITTNITADGIT